MTGPAAFTLDWTPTQAEFDAFAQVSGDDNPIHVDPAFSARTRFGRTVSHGMLLYAKVWGLIRSRFPVGRQVAQTLVFAHPTFAGEPVRIEVAEIGRDAAGLRLAVAVRRIADGASGLAGEALFAWGESQ